MRLPLWLIGILFACWTIWSTHYFYCNICGCCDSSPALGVAASSPTKYDPPMYKWNESQAITGTPSADWRAKVLAAGGQGDTLTLTGYYRADEQNNTKFANLGEARAAVLRPLFAPDVPESRIKLSGRLVTDDMNKTNVHESLGYGWSKMVLAKEAGAIIESGNVATILFPFNSTAKDSDPKVEAFLNELGARHKSDNSTFTVVGHTDNVGGDEQNTKLGMGRALVTRRQLSKYGIAIERITADSKGEAEPIADNTTDDGRHQNRRVVITVNPK